MKILILSIFCVATFLNQAHCQIDKGSLLLGGDFSFSSETETQKQGSASETNSLIRVAPRLGYAFNDRFVLGGFLSLDFEPGLRSSTTTLKIGPFVRYYYPLNFNTYLLGETTFGYGFTKTSTSNGADDPIITLTDFSAGPGLSYFVTQSFAVEALFKYAYTNSLVSGQSSSKGGVQFSVGIQFFLNK